MLEAQNKDLLRRVEMLEKLNKQSPNEVKEDILTSLCLLEMKKEAKEREFEEKNREEIKRMSKYFREAENSQKIILTMEEADEAVELVKHNQMFPVLYEYDRDDDYDYTVDSSIFTVLQN